MAVPGGSDRFVTALERRADGSMLLVPCGTLPAYPQRLTDRLVHWAAATPDRTCFARRGAGGEWRRLTYGEVLASARAIGTALLRHDLSADRPIVILSGNGLEHQLLALGAMYVGIPYVPVSAAYTLADASLGKIRQIASLLTPGLVAAFGPEPFGSAVEAAAGPDALIVSDEPRGIDRPVLDFSGLVATPATDAADRAHQRVGPDTIAKFLLTSGSTGTPKAVITTQRMLCSNQAMLRLALPFLEAEPPTLVDWLPWNHVFGGSHNVGIALMNGGSFYIDDGRPTPLGMAETVRNLKEVSPTVYFNVPKGFEALVPFLRTDRGLRESFFRQLRANFYAGATLAQPVWNDLDELSLATTGRRVPMITGLGATETGPSVTFTTPEMSRAGSIGLPVTGLVAKLAPVGGKLELRAKGPNVMPGYWRQPAATASAFDEDGYYRLGDGARFVDPADVRRGLRFDGRLSEDFKLSTGTWVSVGPLRMAVLDALAPLAQDVVIGAPERDYVTLLVLLDPKGCGERLGVAGELTDLAALARVPSVRAEVAARLMRFGDKHPSTSMRVVRALILDTPPSLPHGEITDKGSINQRAIRERRAELLEALYAPTVGADVLAIFEQSAS
jgi:feruloyl-CoA synthase